MSPVRKNLKYERVYEAKNKAERLVKKRPKNALRSKARTIVKNTLP